MQRDLGQRMSVCRDGIARIERMLQESPGNWQEYLNYARSIIASLDQVNSIPPSIARSEQAWAVTTLQKLAFQDADTGGVPWLSDWCQRQWLRMIEWDQSDVDSLRGSSPLVPSFLYNCSRASAHSGKVWGITGFSRLKSSSPPSIERMAAPRAARAALEPAMEGPWTGSAWELHIPTVNAMTMLPLLELLWRPSSGCTRPITSKPELYSFQQRIF